MNKKKIHILNTTDKSSLIKFKVQISKQLSSSIDYINKYFFTDKNKPIFIILFLLALIGDIFFTSTNSDLTFFGLTLLLVLIILFYKIKSRYTFMLCLILLMIMYYMFLTQGTSVQTEKVAVWIVLFMAVGIGKQWFENEKK